MSLRSWFENGTSCSAFDSFFNETWMLRQLHTVNSRYNIRALYIDEGANEVTTTVVRYQQRMTWIQFLRFLCSFNTDDMRLEDYVMTKVEPWHVSGQVISKCILRKPSTINFAGCKDFKMDKWTEIEQSKSLHIDNCSRSCPNLSCNMADILQSFCFIDCWLKQIKVSEYSVRIIIMRRYVS